MGLQTPRMRDKQLNIRQKKELTESQFGSLLAIPAMLIFAIVILYPFIKSVYYSFTNEKLLSNETSWVGLENYLNNISSNNFIDLLINTLVFVSITTFVPLVIAFAWSIVLVQGFKGESFLRTITLYCWVLPIASIGLLWKWIFDANHGFLNELLSKWGLISENINFLGNTTTAMMAVCVAMIWHSFPWMMAFLLGSLNSVPQEQIEAVRMDGGNNMSILRNVILPHMKPILFVIVILSLINRFQHFDLIWVMTEGGPAHSTTTFSIEVYKQAFQNFNVGQAAATGMIWVLSLSILIFVYMRRLKEDA